MSLILEALHKAEENQSNTDRYNIPHAYPPEKQAHTKWHLLLIIIATCATSALVTVFVFNNLISNTKTNQPAQNKELLLAQKTSPQQSRIQPNTKQIEVLAIEHKTTATVTTPIIKPVQNEALAERSNLSAYREPGLHHFVKNTVESEQGNLIKTPNKTNTLNKEEATTTLSKSSSSSKIDKTDREYTNNINAATNLRFSDIKINVHMYSEIPAKRFVYINSTRYSEGSKINNDLSIEEITENGIIISNNGILYRLPLKQ